MICLSNLPTLTLTNETFLVTYSLDNAGFILAGIDEKSLLQAVDTAIAMNRNHDNGTPVDVYIGENVSNIVVKLIQSYVTVINKMVWRKE